MEGMENTEIKDAFKDIPSGKFDKHIRFNQEMTKLEQEICNAIVWDSPGDNAKAAAEVAKKYIEKALDMYEWHQGETGTFTELWKKNKEAWLKENGIIG